MDIAEFLLARIAEDEAANDALVRGEVASCRADGMPDTTEEQIRAFWGDQAWWRRRLAECEAKRRIVERESGQVEYNFEGPGEPPAKMAGTWYLRALAMPYADHPDYQPEWSPLVVR